MSSEVPSSISLFEVNEVEEENEASQVAVLLRNLINFFTIDNRGSFRIGIVADRVLQLVYHLAMAKPLLSIIIDTGRGRRSREFCECFVEINYKWPVILFNCIQEEEVLLSPFLLSKQ